MLDFLGVEPISGIPGLKHTTVRPKNITQHMPTDDEDFKSDELPSPQKSSSTSQQSQFVQRSSQRRTHDSSSITISEESDGDKDSHEDTDLSRELYMMSNKEDISTYSELSSPSEPIG